MNKSKVHSWLLGSATVLSIASVVALYNNQVANHQVSGDTGVVETVSENVSENVENPVDVSNETSASEMATPVVEQPKVETPAVIQPVEQPKVETPAVTQPVEQPKVETPAVTQPVEQPKVEQPAVTQPVEQPKVETPIVEQPVVTEKGEPLVQSDLPEYHEAKGVPEVQPVLPEAVVSEKGIPEIQPALTELEVPIENSNKVVTEKGVPEVQPELPEAVVIEKGEPLVQPELPEYHEQKGIPEVQPELPEAVVTETGQPLVQPTNPEFNLSNANKVETAKGTPEVHEKPEFTGGVNASDAPILDVPEYKETIFIKGDPEVRPNLRDYHFEIKSRTEKEDIPTKFLNLSSIRMHEGEKKKVVEGQPGYITRVYEDIIGENNVLLNSTLKNEDKVEPIYHVYRYGTAPVNGQVGEDGLYKFSEHIDKLDIAAFNKGITLDGEAIKTLGQDEINKRSKTDVENNLWLVNPTNYMNLTITNAPFSDETIDKFNDGYYVNHKNVGLEMLKLVNQERARLGKSQLKWSDDLHQLSSKRAEELQKNGHIRFFNDKGETLKHVRDNNGTSWLTVFNESKYRNRGVGENLAGYTMPKNIYKAFSEKEIANQLYNQWKNSPGHYANMIADAYTEFGFDMGYSKFWRNDNKSVDYVTQGIHAVQLFAI